MYFCSLNLQFILLNPPDDELLEKYSIFFPYSFSFYLSDSSFLSKFIPKFYYFSFSSSIYTARKLPCWGAYDMFFYKFIYLIKAPSIEEKFLFNFNSFKFYIFFISLKMYWLFVCFKIDYLLNKINLLFISMWFSIIGFYKVSLWFLTEHSVLILSKFRFLLFKLFDMALKF